MKHIHTFSSFLSESLNEGVRKHKGREVYPKWIDPKRDFGAPVKDVKDLTPGAEYVLWEPGMDTWQAEYIYQGYTDGKHRFNSADKQTGGEPIVFTDSEMKEYIKDGDVIKQNGLYDKSIYEGFLNEFGPLAGSGNVDQLDAIKRDAMKKSEGGSTVYVVGGKNGTYKISKYYEEKNTYAAYHNGMPTPVDESLVNEAATPDEYFDYYIAKVDAVVKNPRGKKITIPSGTVIYARGLGRWVSVDGEILVGLEVLKGNADFEVVNNSTWPDTVNLADELEAWGRGTNELIQKDPNNIQKIIDARAKVIEDIRKMLK